MYQATITIQILDFNEKHAGGLILNYGAGFHVVYYKTASVRELTEILPFKDNVPVL